METQQIVGDIMKVLEILEREFEDLLEKKLIEIAENVKDGKILIKFNSGPFNEYTYKTDVHAWIFDRKEALGNLFRMFYTWQQDCLTGDTYEKNIS